MALCGDECLMWWRVLRSAHVAVSNEAICIFSYEYLIEAAKSNRAVKRFGECEMGRSIRLVVKADSMSARKSYRSKTFQMIWNWKNTHWSQCFIQDLSKWSDTYSSYIPHLVGLDLLLHDLAETTMAAVPNTGRWANAGLMLAQHQACICLTSGACTSPSSNVVSMLVQRLHIETTLDECPVFAGICLHG